MKKSEFIERYGLEAYKAHNERNKERNKERYTNDVQYHKAQNNRCRAWQEEHYINDPEFREARDIKTKIYMKVYIRARYVKDKRIDLIENYKLAKADNFKGWDIHHRDEIRLLPSGMIALRSKEELIENGRYYNCPPNELIWMNESEHHKLHRKFQRR